MIQKVPNPEVTRATAEFAGMLENALPKLRQFVRCHAGNVIRAREADSDIVQSVCREAIVDRARFRYGGTRGLNRWLFTRARRKMQDRVRYHRADKRDVARETPLRARNAFDSASSRVGIEPTDTRTPDRAALEHERDDRLRKAIAALPEDYRLVVTLARVEGLSHAEIAQRLGRSEIATRKVLHRALARLAHSL